MADERKPKTDDLPRLKAETVILDRGRNPLAVIDALWWPPIDAVVEPADRQPAMLVWDRWLELHPDRATAYVVVAAATEPKPVATREQIERGRGVLIRDSGDDA